MSPKESNEAFVEKFLKDLDLAPHDEVGVSKVLEFLHTEPSVMSRAQAPTGYESDLLASLRAKLPPEKTAKVATPAPVKRRLWIFSPQFSWSVSGTLAVLVAVLAIGYGRMRVIEVPVPAEGDFLVQAAAKAPTREIASWMSSVGDSATQIRVAQNDLTVVLEEAQKQGSPQLWEKIFHAISGS